MEKNVGLGAICAENDFKYAAKNVCEDFVSK
jgi:hypothetical protein